MYCVFVTSWRWKLECQHIHQNQIVMLLEKITCDAEV